MLAGLIWAIGGTAVVRKLAFPIGYLTLMVPLPFVDRVTLPLALFTGYCSGSIVRFLGMDITIMGNSISLPNADLVVGCLLYTSDAADERSSVDLGGRRIIKKKIEEQNPKGLLKGK